jgi:hypothetical protein
VIADDGSIISKDGRTLFYSWPRFVEEICKGDNCFICGSTSREVRFSREHILPDWLLHQFKLHGKTVNLPNGNEHRYGTYTLPCCVECNSQLGEEYEVPISQAVSLGFDGVHALVEREGTGRLFVWMASIFLKLHLKDEHLRMHLDHRLGDASIAADYEWVLFHHLHCLVRALHTGAQIDHRVLGSLVIMGLTSPPNGDEGFDLVSITAGHALYLRLGEVALFAVFNDSGASLQGLSDVVSRIEGPLNPLQAREFIAELAACNLHLENRPRFLTTVTRDSSEQVRIEALVDPTSGPRFAPKDHALVGHFKFDVLNYWVDRMIVPSSGESPADLLRQNAISLIFDDDGQFIKEGRIPLETAGPQGAA